MKLLTSLGLALAVLATPIAAQDTPKPVKLMQVHETTPGFTRQFFGRVAARHTVDLAFQVAGQIVEMPVNEGFVIPKGGLIARLDQEPFELRLERRSCKRNRPTEPSHACRGCGAPRPARWRSMTQRPKRNWPRSLCAMPNTNWNTRL